MSEEILINVTLMETRVALIENGMLQEIFIERHNARGLVGDLFIGKVVRVMPGMEAAFVDIGLDKAAFIHSSDVAVIDAEGFEVRSEEQKSVDKLLRDGQFLLVQVAKDAIGTKGARLTTRITLPSAGKSPPLMLATLAASSAGALSKGCPWVPSRHTELGGGLRGQGSGGRIGGSRRGVAL